MLDKPQLSKHRASFARSKAKKAGAATSSSSHGNNSQNVLKEHGFDARQFHQNANRKEIKSLVKFKCPVCGSKNSITVHMEQKRGIATVKCGVCLSFQPPPPDLPYPYETRFVPSLENKADVFFRFLDAFERISLQNKEQGISEFYTVFPSSCSPHVGEEGGEGVGNEENRHPRRDWMGDARVSNDENKRSASTDDRATSSTLFDEGGAHLLDGLDF